MIHFRKGMRLEVAFRSPMKSSYLGKTVGVSVGSFHSCVVRYVEESRVIFDEGYNLIVVDRFVGGRLRSFETSILEDLVLNVETFCEKFEYLEGMDFIKPLYSGTIVGFNFDNLYKVRKSQLVINLEK